MGKNKKVKNSPFMAFMKSRRRQLEADGTKFPGGWKDIAQTVSDEWTSMNKFERKRWEVAAQSLPKFDTRPTRPANFPDGATASVKKGPATSTPTPSCEVSFSSSIFEDEVEEESMSSSREFELASIDKVKLLSLKETLDDFRHEWKTKLDEETPMLRNPMWEKNREKIAKNWFQSPKMEKSAELMDMLETVARTQNVRLDDEDDSSQGNAPPSAEEPLAMTPTPKEPLASTAPAKALRTAPNASDFDFNEPSAGERERRQFGRPYVHSQSITLRSSIAPSTEQPKLSRGPRGWFDNMEEEYFSLQGEAATLKKRVKEEKEILEIVETPNVNPPGSSAGDVFSSKEEEEAMLRAATYYAPDLFMTDFSYAPECRDDMNMSNNHPGINDDEW